MEKLQEIHSLEKPYQDLIGQFSPAYLHSTKFRMGHYISVINPV